MPEKKINPFDVILLVVGVGAGFLGFHLIKIAYVVEGSRISWMMVITIFSWLILLVLFIMLSLTVDLSRRELNEMKSLIFLLSEQQNNRKK